MIARPVNLMQMYLTELGEEEVLGTYGKDKDKLAERMRYLHPTAAQAFRVMNADKTVRCSDMLRTPEGSLLNRKRKGKGLRPGWSGHNYGFSIDIDVGWVLEKHGFVDKTELDLWMQSYGWYCHNILGEPRSFEAWHYNYFGDEAEHYLSFRVDSKKGTWSNPVSKKILEYYGHWWENASVKDLQVGLKKLGMYGGDLDGDPGELFEESVQVFQRAWMLDVDGVAGSMSKRTIMLVSAERCLVDREC